MKRIRLTEKDILNIVRKVINESNGMDKPKPKVRSTYEPPERNYVDKIDFKPPVKDKPDMYDEHMDRAEFIQNILDRVMLHGDEYVSEIKEINKRYSIKKDKFGRYT